MYVLFIPSFPNNRFHLGNIRTKQKEKKERKRMKQKLASLFVTNLLHCVQFENFAEILLLLLFLYFIYNCGGVLSSGALLHFFKLAFVSFLFLSFLFVGKHKQNRSLPQGDWQRQRLQLNSSSSFFFWLIRKETRGAPGRFVFLPPRVDVSFRFFELEFRLNFSNYNSPCARAKVIRLLACAAPQRKMCFTQQRTFVPV